MDKFVYVMTHLPGSKVATATVTDRKMTWVLPHVGGHSDDFGYGYYGCGASDLATSLLAHALGESDLYHRGVEGLLSKKLSHRFKEFIIGPTTAKSWTILQQSILHWIAGNIWGTLDEYFNRRDSVRKLIKAVGGDEDDGLSYAEWDTFCGYESWLNNQIKNEVVS